MSTAIIRLLEIFPCFFLIVAGSHHQICNQDNFSLGPVCSDLGFEVDEPLNMEMLQAITLLDEHIKRITTYCDCMHFCLEYAKIYSHVGLSDVLATWEKLESQNRICMHLGCIDSLLKNYRCLRPIPATVLQVTKLICGLCGYNLNGQNIVKNTEVKVPLACLSSALALIQYAGAEAHRTNSSNLIDSPPHRQGLHHEECGTHNCPFLNCPNTCLENARKYACLQLRCSQNPESVAEFFSWMMGGNKKLLSSASRSMDLCLSELPLEPKHESLIDIAMSQGDENVEIGYSKGFNFTGLLAFCVILFSALAILLIVAVIYRRTIASTFLRNRTQYIRMNER